MDVNRAALRSLINDLEHSRTLHLGKDHFLKNEKLFIEILTRVTRTKLFENFRSIGQFSPFHLCPSLCMAHIAVMCVDKILRDVPINGDLDDFNASFFYSAY